MTNAENKPRMPAGVIEVRRELCAVCPSPCVEFREGDIRHDDPCAACPMVPRRFGPYGDCTKYERPANVRGLGDVVAVVTQPIARVIDRVVGTNIAECGGCKKRRAALNAAVPFRP